MILCKQLNYGIMMKFKLSYRKKKLCKKKITNENIDLELEKYNMAQL